MKKHIKLFGLLSLVLIGGVLTSCGSAKDYSENTNQSEYSGEENYINGTKVVYTVYLEFQSDNAKALEIEVRNKITEYGGYVAYTDETKNGRYFLSNVTYKIPSEKLNEFESFIDTKDSLTTKTKTSENITGKYVSNEVMLEALQKKLEIYNAKYLEATELSQQLELLDKISEIEMEIYKEQKTLELMNNAVDYSTIKASFASIYDIEEPSRLSQYLDYLRNIGEDLLWSLAYSTPFLLLAGIGVTIFVCLKKKKLDKNK